METASSRFWGHEKETLLWGGEDFTDVTTKHLLRSSKPKQETRTWPCASRSRLRGLESQPGGAHPDGRGCNQPTIAIKVFEGERALVKDSHCLAEFDVTGHRTRTGRQADRGPLMDKNGILTATATDDARGAC